MLLALPSVPARAGSISVVNLPATGTDAASGIWSTNTYLCALDLGTTVTAVSVNGVSFQQLATANTPGSGTTNNPVIAGTDPVSGGTWELSGTNNGISTSGFGSVASGGAAIASQADGNMRALLTDASFLGGSVQPGATYVLTCGGLTAEASYSLRCYYRQWSSTGTFPRRPIAFTFNGEGVDESYPGNLDIDAGLAHYIKYDFTAAASTVKAVMTVQVAVQGPMVYAMTLHQTAAPGTPISIDVQPQGITNWAGKSFTLSVTASGSAPVYQWYKDGSVVDGATSASLNFPSLTMSDAGAYHVVVTNSLNARTSSVAMLGVVSGVWPLAPSLSLVQLPATDTDVASDIWDTNTYLCALDFGSDTTPLAINGVNFQQIALSGNGLGPDDNRPLLVGGDSNYGGSWALSGFYYGNQGFSNAAPVQTQADGSLGLLLNDYTYLSGTVATNSTVTLELGGLTEGTAYSLRCYYRQLGSGHVMNFTVNGHGTNETCQTDFDNGGAYYLQYDFVAASDHVTMVMTTINANSGPNVYGATLQVVGTVPPPALPAIEVQPHSTTNWAGNSQSLLAVACGAVPLTYQWYKDGSLLDGQTNPSLDFPGLALSDAGSYQLVVTNVAGAVTSSVAVLGVVSGEWPLSPSLSIVQLPAIDTDNASGISSANTYLCALDFGNTTTPVAINGVSFQQLNLNGQGSGVDTNHPVFVGTDSNYGGTWTLSGEFGGTSGVLSRAGGNGGQADGWMLALLTDMTFMGGSALDITNGSTATLDLGGLAAGASYSLRYYYRQWSQLRLVNFTFNGQGRDETCQTDLDLGGTYYLKYDFTAASDHVTLTATVINPGNGPHFYAVTLQQTAVPPPVLHYSFSGHSLTLWWDAGVTDFVLESATDLPATVWVPVSGVVGNNVIVDTSTGTQLYRLRK